VKELEEWQSRAIDNGGCDQLAHPKPYEREWPAYLIEVLEGAYQRDVISREQLFAICGSLDQEPQESTLATRTIEPPRRVVIRCDHGED
jgi:hypothetical protein